MSIPTSLLLKGIGGVAAVATPITFGVIHRDKVSSFFAGNKTGSDQDKAENIGKKLGLPSDCNVFEAMTDTINCQNLNETKLKAINFENKDSENLNVTGNASVNLTISNETDKNKFPKGLKFSFKTSSGTVSFGSGENQITLNTEAQEFKINNSDNSNWKLEKIWKIKEWGEKVGLECSESEGKKECSQKSGSTINVKDGNNKLTGANIETGKKIKFEENVDDHNKKFKFYVEEDTSLTGGTQGTSLTSANTSYEIKYDSNEWFLSKKTTTPTES